MFVCHVCNKDLKYQMIFRYMDHSHCSGTCISSYMSSIKRNKLDNTVVTEITNSSLIEYVKSVLNCFGIDDKEKKN